LEPFYRLGADIVVLQEIRQSEVELFSDATSCVWLGPATGKGIAVIGYNGWSLEEPLACSERWFLPAVAVRGSDRLHIVAVWVADERGSYIAPTLRALECVRDFVSGGRAIIIGDFNANVAWDRTGSASKYGFGKQLGVLKDLGFTSVWHHSQGDDHGAEMTPTRFQARREASPYHVDYAFTSPSSRWAWR
jgi:hypothetical protein